MTVLPETSLIICSRNRPYLLRDTVRSVLAGSTLPSELIIVDQSTEPQDQQFTGQSEERCSVRYIWTQSVGLSRARNIGIGAATYDIVVFIDDDMLVPPDWLSIAVSTLVKHGARSVVTGRVLPTAYEGRATFASAAIADRVPRVYAGRVGRDVLAGAQMVMYRRCFADVGLFDERFGAGTEFPAEDGDLGYRLLEAGYRIVYEPKSVVFHRAWRPARTFWRWRWGYGRGAGGFYAKHWRLSDPFIPLCLLRNLWRHIRRVPHQLLRDPRTAAGNVVYCVGLLSGTVQWLIRERWLQR